MCHHPHLCLQVWDVSQLPKSRREPRCCMGLPYLRGCLDVTHHSTISSLSPCTSQGLFLSLWTSHAHRGTGDSGDSHQAVDPISGSWLQGSLSLHFLESSDPFQMKQSRHPSAFGKKKTFFSRQIYFPKCLQGKWQPFMGVSVHP